MKKILPNFKIIPPYIWLLMLGMSLLFILFPEIDFYISALFYDSESGFFSSNEVIIYFLYNSIKILLVLIYTGLFLLYLYNRKMKKSLLNFTGKKLLYLISVLVIGSGLIVNATLKEHWGRARPQHIVEFGGNKTFTPPFVISDQGGNSFSSGHASAAFVFMAFAMLAVKNRKRWMALALIYGASVGLVRIMVGGHFFSDTIVSFFIMYITTMLLYDLFFKDSKSISEK